MAHAAWRVYFSAQVSELVIKMFLPVRVGEGERADKDPPYFCGSVKDRTCMAPTSFSFLKYALCRTITEPPYM